MASIKIKQQDIKDCSAACLVSIFNHCKVNLPATFYTVKPKFNPIVAFTFLTEKKNTIIRFGRILKI